MNNKENKIMICDDDHGIIEVLEMILAPEGYTVIKEIDSTLLINRMFKEMPDLIILDLWMPIISGHELIKLIRANDKIKDIPILILSASRNERNAALVAGADDFISKPFDMDEILKIVHHFIQKNIYEY